MNAYYAAAGFWVGQFVICWAIGSLLASWIVKRGQRDSTKHYAVVAAAALTGLLTYLGARNYGLFDSALSVAAWGAAVLVIYWRLSKLPA